MIYQIMNVIILNLSKGSLNLINIPITFLELINKLMKTINDLKIIHIIIYFFIGYYLIKSLKNYSKLVPKDKKKKKK